MNLLKILDGTPEPPIIDLRLEKVDLSGEYNLPTPMYEFQKELTDQIVSLHYPDILKYCETNDTNQLIIKSLEICIENCILVSTHPYLLISHYMPKNLALKDMLSKLADTSGKFDVLRDLVNVIISNDQKNNKNVGIVMKNNAKFFDLVEALVLGCSGSKVIRRYVGNYVKKDTPKPNKNSQNLTSIHLLPHDGNVTRDEESLAQVKFDLLIVFDSYVDKGDQFFRRIRGQNRRFDAAIIRLVPLRTIEHSQLHYHQQIENQDYLYRLISSIVCLRESIGILSPDLFPIYKQKLKYLSHTFFDNHFKQSRSISYAAWPLPGLPRIPKFNAIDVERSLLTEVRYHYTPYDSLDDIDSLQKTQTKRLSYYESKRLELDYVTNPLRNDMNKLIGIYGNTSLENTSDSEVNKNVLTHLLITNLKAAYLHWSLVTEENDIYSKINSPEFQKRVGRREESTKVALSKLLDDVDHSQSRINFANKTLIKRQEELDELRENIKYIETDLENFLANNDIENENSKVYYEQQMNIWNTREEIRTFISRIKSKQEEKSFMNSELEHALNSIQSFTSQLEQSKNEHEDLKRKLDVALEAEEKEQQEVSRQKIELISKIDAEKEKNEQLKKRLGKTLKFLKDTSHLKKRKARGATPNPR